MHVKLHVCNVTLLASYVIAKHRTRRAQVQLVEVHPKSGYPVADREESTGKAVKREKSRPKKSTGTRTCILLLTDDDDVTECARKL